MKYKLLILLIVNLTVPKVIGQTNEVRLVVSSKGTTEEDAKTNALRSAIEQAFGTFVSSRTEIMNDELVQDQIVSLSNGNIKKFDIVSSLYLPEQNAHLVTLNATVSLDKLASFVQSKGYNDVSFDGGGFTMNLKIQKLNASSEVIAIRNLLEQGLNTSHRFFDRTLQVASPKSFYGDRYVVPLVVQTKLNSNWLSFRDYFINTLKSISMPREEVETYVALNKSVYQYVVVDKFFKSYDSYQRTEKITEYPVYRALDTLYFRSPTTLMDLTSFYILLNAKYLDNVSIVHDIDTVNLDIDDNPKYPIGSGNPQYIRNNTWKVERMPFDNFTSVLVNMQVEDSYEPLTVKGKNVGSKIVKKIVYNINPSGGGLQELLLPILSFSDSKGFRINSGFSNYISLFSAINNTDYRDALKTISDKIFAIEMPGSFSNYMGGWPYTPERIYNVDFPISEEFLIEFNAEFSEEDLQNIRGFKLMKY
jgi:hypothetical protein